jgi:prevent-host-death family protein
MDQNVVSMREIQRNYRKVIDWVKSDRKPVFLSSHGKTEAVLMDIEEFRKLEEKSEKKKRTIEWEEMKKVLEDLSTKGRQGISLSEFVIRDRHAH